MREDHRITSDTFNRLKNEWEDLKTKTATKNLFKEINDNLEEETINLRQKHADIAGTKLKDHEQYINEEYKKFKEDP